MQPNKLSWMDYSTDEKEEIKGGRAKSLSSSAKEIGNKFEAIDNMLPHKRRIRQ